MIWHREVTQEQGYSIEPVMVITRRDDNYTDKSKNLRQNSFNRLCVPTEKTMFDQPCTQISEQDRLVLHWLASAEEAHTMSVQWREFGLTIQCSHVLQAHRLLDALDLLLQTDLRYVKIYVGKESFSSLSLDRLRGSTSSASKAMLATIETMPSVWARQNLNVLKAIPGTVALLSADPGHRYLAIKPEIAEGRLNKPIDFLINQPLRAIDEELWVPRERAIQTVLGTGENEIYHYTHYWEGLLWHFKCTVAKASETEIMTIVEDAEDHAQWQKQWWKNRIAASAR